MERTDLEKAKSKINKINTAGLILLLLGILFTGMFFFLGIGALYYANRLRKEAPELESETVLKTATGLYSSSKEKYEELDEQQQKYALGGGAGAILLLALIAFVLGIKPKVTIAVIDQAGAPVAGVELTADGDGCGSSNATTDGEGNVTFEDLCAETTYSVSVRENSHRVFTPFEFTVVETATLENSITLEKLGTFSGKTVNFVDGAALANVTVRLSTDSEKSGCSTLSGSSGDDGAVSITGLCAGESYSVAKSDSPILINTTSFKGADSYTLAEELRYVATTAIEVSLDGVSLSTGQIEAEAKAETIPADQEFPVALCSKITKDVSSSEATLDLCNGLTYNIYLNEPEHMFTKAVSVVVDGKTTKVSGPAGKLKQLSCVDVIEKRGVRCPDRSYDCLPDVGDYFCYTELFPFYPEGQDKVNNWERDGHWAKMEGKKTWFKLDSGKKVDDYDGKPTIRTSDRADVYLYGDAVKDYSSGTIVGSGYFRKYDQGVFTDDMHIEVETLLTSNQYRKYSALKSFAETLANPKSLKIRQSNGEVAEELYIAYNRIAARFQRRSSKSKISYGKSKRAKSAKEPVKEAAPKAAKETTSSSGDIDDALKFILYTNRTSAEGLKKASDEARERRISKADFMCNYSKEDVSNHCAGQESCPIKEGESYFCAKDYVALFDESNADGFYWATSSTAKDAIGKLVMYSAPKTANQKSHEKGIKAGDKILSISEFDTDAGRFSSSSVAPIRLGKSGLRYAVGYLKSFNADKASIEHVRDISEAEFTKGSAVINLRTQLAALESGKSLRHFGSRLESFYFANQNAQSVLSETELAALFLIASADAGALSEKALAAIKDRQVKEKEHIAKLKTEVLETWKADSYMKPYMLANSGSGSSQDTIDRFPVEKPNGPMGMTALQQKSRSYLPTNGKCGKKDKNSSLASIAKSLIYKDSGSVSKGTVSNGRVSVTIPVDDSVSAPSVKVKNDCYRPGSCGSCSSHSDCSGWTCGCSQSRCTVWGTCTRCPASCTKDYSWRVKDYKTSFKADISDSEASNLRYELLYSKVKNYCHPELSADKTYIKPVGLRITSGGETIYSKAINTISDTVALKKLGIDGASVHTAIKE